MKENKKSIAFYLMKADKFTLKAIRAMQGGLTARGYRLTLRAKEYRERAYSLPIGGRK